MNNMCLQDCTEVTVLTDNAQPKMGNGSSLEFYSIEISFGNANLSEQHAFLFLFLSLQFYPQDLGRVDFFKHIHLLQALLMTR